MNILVTGAGGLVGKALTLELAKSGHQVKALYHSRVPTALANHENITLLGGDIQNPDFLKRATEGVEGIFHVAAFARPWTPQPKLYYDINERGTINLCEAAVTNGVRRLVYTASAGIHGPEQGALIDENTWPGQYYTDYEKSKNNGRLAVLSYHEKGLETCVVSPARVYGPGEITESNVPARMMHIYFKRKFGFVPASGNGVGSYVYIDDVVHGHILAMTNGTPGEEYLLGGDNLSYNEFFHTLAQVSGKNYPVIKVPYKMSLFIGKSMLFMAENFGIHPTITTPWVRRYLENWGISTKKIEALGYRPISLEEGMSKVIPSALRPPRS